MLWDYGKYLIIKFFVPKMNFSRMLTRINLQRNKVEIKSSTSSFMAAWHIEDVAVTLTFIPSTDKSIKNVHQEASSL